jgi:hypothetical protein
MTRSRAFFAIELAAGLVLFGAVTRAQLLTLPKKVAPPPPSTTSGTRECEVGTLHDLVQYRRDLGCLRGNLAVATLAPTPLDKAWAASVAGAARELGSFASTLDREQPESMSLEAVALELVPTQIDRTPKDVREALCGFAESTYTDACIAYYCGSTEIRGPSPALNEMGTKLERLCSTKPQCLPKDLDLNRETCQKRWHEDEERLAAAIRARQHVFRNGIYSPHAIEAVQDWSVAQSSYRDQLRASVFSGKYEPLPGASDAVTAKAAAALFVVRQDEVTAQERQLTDVKRAVEDASHRQCSEDQAAACKVERARKNLEMNQLQESVHFEKTRVGEAEHMADPILKLKLLRPELGGMVDRMKGPRPGGPE